MISTDDISRFSEMVKGRDQGEAWEWVRAGGLPMRP
jgi:hypothetical protein